MAEVSALLHPGRRGPRPELAAGRGRHRQAFFPSPFYKGDGQAATQTAFSEFAATMLFLHAVRGADRSRHFSGEAHRPNPIRSIWLRSSIATYAPGGAPGGPFFPSSPQAARSASNNKGGVFSHGVLRCGTAVGDVEVADEFGAKARRKTDDLSQMLRDRVRAVDRPKKGNGCGRRRPAWRATWWRQTPGDAVRISPRTTGLAQNGG